jgi:hypothetical protein
MEDISYGRREAIQDIWYGQIVTIVARWFLIGTGLLLTYWTAESTSDAIGPTYVLVLLIATNFLLHGRFLTGSPMRREIVFAGCVVDTVMISLIVLTGWWDAGKGIDSPFFIFYYPVLLAFALVFPRSLSYGFALAALVAYTTIVALTLPEGRIDYHVVEPMVARLATLGSTVVLGNLYWRTQRRHQQSRLAGG